MRLTVSRCQTQKLPEKTLFGRGGYGGFYDTWPARDKQELSDADLIAFTGSPRCWRPLHHGKPVKGWRLDNEALRRYLPATVSEIAEMGKEFAFRPNNVRGKRGHQYWGLDKGYLAIEKFT